MLDGNLTLNINFSGKYERKEKAKLSFKEKKRQQKQHNRQKRASTKYAEKISLNTPSSNAGNGFIGSKNFDKPDSNLKQIENENAESLKVNNGFKEPNKFKKKPSEPLVTEQNKFKKKPSEPVVTEPSKFKKKPAEPSIKNVNNKIKKLANISQGKLSSLFGNNPDIPNITMPNTEIVKEDVFSQQSFENLNLHPFMVKNLNEKLAVTQVTLVQHKTIPLILKGQDVLVKSQTGSGKTLAYAIPLVHLLQSIEPKISRTDGPYAFVIVPTRELAIQSFDTFVKLVNPFSWIVPGCIMGGERKKSEKARLRKGVNILIATPGRLLDHLKHTESLKLSHIKWLIIDEADRLLDLGYEKDVTEILSILNTKCPQLKQTVLLSATLTAGVERLAGMTLTDAVQVDAVVSSSQEKSKSLKHANVVDINQKFATPEGLQHYFVIVPIKLRLVCLASFLLWKCRYDPKHRKIVVFLPTQDSVDFHYDLFQHTICSAGDESEENMQLFKLHGNMLQKERTQVFRTFCDMNSAAVLLCTDVASRGLDMPAVQWIIQYSAPTSPMDYIHRVGRTARIGHRGSALLFISPSEVDYLQIVSELNVSLKELKMDDILKILSIFVQNIQLERKQVPHSVQECATYVHTMFEEFVIAEPSANELARKAYQSFIRAYSSYPSGLKHIFHTKSLHLGHVAKSFALRETPLEISDKVGQMLKKQSTERKLFKSQKRNRQDDDYQSVSYSDKNIVQQALMSEYDSGLGTPSAKKRKQR